MKGFVCVALLFLCMVLVPITTAASLEVTDGNPPQATWGSKIAVVPVTAVIVSAGGSESAPLLTLRKGTSRKDRRALGLTFRGVRKALVELRGSGEVSDDMTTEEVSVIVLGYLVDANPQAFGGDPQRDWSGFLDFLENLIPFILKIMALFGL